MRTKKRLLLKNMWLFTVRCCKVVSLQKYCNFCGVASELKIDFHQARDGCEIDNFICHSHEPIYLYILVFVNFDKQ